MISSCHVILALTMGLNSATDIERPLLWDACCTLNCLQIKDCMTTPARQQNGFFSLVQRGTCKFCTDKLRQLSPHSLPLHFSFVQIQHSYKGSKKTVRQFPMPGYQVSKRTLTTFCCPFLHAQDSWFHGLIHYFKHT